MSGFSMLLQLSVLLLLAGMLDPSSHLEGDPVLPEELEQQLTGPEPSPWDGLQLIPCLCSALNTLLSAVFLARCLGRAHRRRCEQEKRRRPSASAGSCCRGRCCCQQLLRLLRDNLALMELCLQRCSAHKALPRERSQRRCGLWKRRRVRFCPRPRLSGSSPALG